MIYSSTIKNETSLLSETGSAYSDTTVARITSPYSSTISIHTKSGDPIFRELPDQNEFLCLDEDYERALSLTIEQPPMKIQTAQIEEIVSLPGANEGDKAVEQPVTHIICETLSSESTLLSSCQHSIKYVQKEVFSDILISNSFTSADLSTREENVSLEDGHFR
jgi:hypothetical protein